MLLRCCLLLAAALLLLLPAPGSTMPAAREFPDPGFRVDGPLVQFWERNGGLAVFGLPISEQRREAGVAGRPQAQWFERERLELHPANPPPYDVQLGRLGVEALERAGRDWRNFPQVQPQPACRFFAETGQNLCEPFLSYWQNHGLEFDGRAGHTAAESLALFGMPLSAPAMETNSSNATVLTQWFERARFEYLPDNPPGYQVLLGRLGAEVYAPGRANLDPAAMEPPQFHQIREPGWPAPLEVPRGFTVREIAGGLTRPRFMALDQDGSLVYASDASSQVLRLRDEDGDGYYETRQVIAGDLAYVHSVAFVDGALYAAAEDRVVRLADFAADGAARQMTTVLDGLPTGASDLYGHRTRTLLAGPDGWLYLSIGSSCDVCVEQNPLRATVVRFRPDGSGLEVFAGGLRNSVGIAFRPDSGELWGADMGRNNLGPDLPPEEFNRIEAGGDYGWPYCYGDRLPDPAFGDPARCANTLAPRYSFPAHWAPLGVVFYDQAGFPASYQGDALIAFHGSAPDQIADDRRGYRVVRLRFKNGQPVAHEDLLRGFVAGGEVWGRPAGLLVAPDGSLLVSDDYGGRIFRVGN